MSGITSMSVASAPLLEAFVNGVPSYLFNHLTLV